MSNSIELSIRAHKGHLTRLTKKAEVTYDENPEGIEIFQGIVLNMEHHIECLNTKQMELYNAYENENKFNSEDEVTEFIDNTGEIITNGSIFVCKLKNTIKRLEGSAQINTATPNASSYMVKLPRIDLEKFDGSFTNWPSFWDSFESNIDKRSELSNVNKLQYLKSSLVGQAKKLVENHSITNDNYPKVIQLLKDKYSHPEKIKFELFCSLYDMKAPSNSLEDLDSYRINLSSCLTNLEANKVEVDHYSLAIFPIVFRKLPSLIREKIQLRCGKDYPTIKEMLKGLDQVIANMSSLSVTKSNLPNKDNNFKFKFNKPKPFEKMSETKLNKTDISNFNVTLEDKTNNKKACIFCEGNHSPTDCGKFHTVEMKQNRIIDLGGCVKCLRRSHVAKDCKVKLYDCILCKGKHHKYYCNPKADISVNVSVKNIAENASEFNKSIILPTATINVYTSDGMKKIRCMFDNCAQATFILPQAAKELKLISEGKTKATIGGLGVNIPSNSYDQVNLVVKGINSDIKVNALVTDSLPETVQTAEIGKVVEELSKLIDLADPTIQGNSVNNIKLLVGLDNYYKFFPPPKVVKDIVILESEVGNVMIGEIKNATSTINHLSTNSITVCHMAAQKESDINNVTKLWDLDAIGIVDQKHSPDDIEAQDLFNKTVKYDENKYEICLPWKSNAPELPTNYGLALGRLRSTHNKLKQDPPKLNLYNNILNEQLKNKFIEIVTNPKVEANTHYLPHFDVTRESKTTPLRVVFDCSAKINKKASLNDCLLKGPSLNEELIKFLIRFRIDSHAVVGDISKAFLRVGLNEKDRDFTRFLWYDENNNLKTYRFRSVLFGATSSPFLLQAVLNHHFQKYEDDYVVSFLKNQFYVDNLIGTVETEDKLLKIYEQGKHIMLEAGMPTQDWISNSKKLNKLIMKDNDVLNIKEGTTTKVLGLKWDYIEDTISFNNVFFDDVMLTKTSLLSNISKVFDPLGLISPITVKGKILMQKSWINKIGWNDKLPSDIVKEWDKLKEDYSKILSLKFPRQVGDTNKMYSLHLFADASKKAFGCAAYLVNNNNTSNLIMSKSRVSPLQTLTIPRLELNAVLLAAKLGKYIHETLSNVKIEETYIWTDSEIALQWVLNQRSKEVYIQNRVKEINELAGKYKFLHINTKENPADLISRGCSTKSLINSTIWFNGPTWLINKEFWPEQSSKFYQEEKVDINVQTALIEPSNKLFNYENFSKFSKLIGSVKYVIKFINILKTKINKAKINKENNDKNALKVILKDVQLNNFSKEIKYCKNPNGKTPELVKNLSLFLDNEGLMRCKGRIGNSNLPYDSKYPILIPKNSNFTRILIDHLHRLNLHSGVNETIAKIREKFWLTSCRQLVKKVLHSCYECKRLGCAPFRAPQPPDLPEYRVNNDRKPFETAGVDLTGNILIHDKESKTLKKYYIVLFTCTLTRAVHLEVVDSLSAEAFLNAFRRFISRRGCPKLLISDNATNFKLSAKIIKNLSINVNESLEQFHCAWKFIPARSPHFGGFYERLIGVVKSCLMKTIYKKKLNIDEFFTIIHEVENRVNNRPITYIDNSINSVEPLTPSHLINGRRLNSLPTLIELENDPNYLTTANANVMLKKVNETLNYFQKIWAKEYLINLRENHKVRSYKCSQFQKINLGDVVLLHEEGPRSSFRMGKVIELLYGKDKILRVVKLITKGGETIRSIQNLYPLETSTEENKDESKIDNSSTTSNDVVAPSRNMQRVAKHNFNKRIKSLVKDGSL